MGKAQEIEYKKARFRTKKTVETNSVCNLFLSFGLSNS